MRAVLAAINICQQLLQLNRKASIGVTFGSIFCGVVGSPVRHEYTVRGATATHSHSARLRARPPRPPLTSALCVMPAPVRDARLRACCPLRAACLAGVGRRR